MAVTDATDQYLSLEQYQDKTGVHIMVGFLAYNSNKLNMGLYPNNMLNTGLYPISNSFILFIDTTIVSY